LNNNLGLRYQQKLPEIEKSLALVRYLKSQQEEEAEVITRYSLAETIFATAQVECNGIVHLWLGANVMLEYTYEEAIELLSSKEGIAKKEHQNVSII
jgi:prefoldin subunit 5